MIPIKLKVALLGAILAFFIIVLSLLKNKRIALKYTLLWLFTGLILLVLVVFPEILVWISACLNVQNGLNMLFMVMIAFVMIILMSITSIVSRQTEKIRVLTQENALLEKRVRDLENRD